MSVKILLDTDIGSDIDDAICLAYLLSQPDCDLLGITTVTGEAEKRAMLASAICRAYGREVPIFPGCEVPLAVPQKQTKAPQAAALARWDHAEEFPRGRAISFLRRTIHEHAGEVVLLTIGALTNIATLFRRHPEIPGMLRGAVSMCGLFAEPRVEWNAGCDPEATSIVYGARLRMHRSVGLDVTTRVTMGAEEARRRLHSSALGPVLGFAEIWFAENKVITFHDPLAAATIFKDGICRFEKGTVEVELQKQELRGATTFVRGGSPRRHEVAVEVEPRAFLGHFFSTVE